MNDFLITEYILSMGLSIGLAVYIAFRAGRRLSGLTPDNMKERLSDFTLDSLKELICNKLEELFGAQGVQLPARVTLKDVAAHLHSDITDLGFLQSIYHSLVEEGIQSPYYAAAYIVQLVAGVSNAPGL